MLGINVPFKTFLTVLVVDLLATSGDISATWTSPIYPKLYSNDTSINPLGRPITPDEDSWLGSLLNIGAVMGALPMGFLAGKIGRKFTLLIIAVPHIIAYLLFAFANNINEFYIGRVINGFSEGAGYAILPMYIAEITEDSNRAALSTSLNIFWTLGNFIPYALGPYLSIRTFNLILACIPSTFFVCFFFIAPETPHYLVQIGEYSKAELVIMNLRHCEKKEAEKEVGHLREIINEQQDGNLLDIIKNRKLLKALIISLTLIILQQLSGISPVTFYLEPIFQASGSSLSASISSTICGACMFTFSFIAPLIIHRTGKKWPLAISCLGDCLSLAALGAFFYVKEEGKMSIDSISWVPITGLISYIFFFNLAFAPVPWTISSELFPNKVKSVSSSSVAAVNWLLSFFNTKFFNSLTKTLGTAGTFWFYSGFCLFAVVFDIIWVPETTGKTFSEIQAML
ncbi:facilitated trehalose transporter Tret1-like [Euwallacea similis]|uniref:facilitated trehalose transporter Tret1-like n=1 Tax=Euwallacea similis TaxID=1736056 RepID=UPI00344F54FA